MLPNRSEHAEAANRLISLQKKMSGEQREILHAYIDHVRRFEYARGFQDGTITHGPEADKIIQELFLYGPLPSLVSNS